MVGTTTSLRRYPRGFGVEEGGLDPLALTWLPGVREARSPPLVPEVNIPTRLEYCATEGEERPLRPHLEVIGSRSLWLCGDKACPHTSRPSACTNREDGAVLEPDERIKNLVLQNTVFSSQIHLILHFGAVLLLESSLRPIVAVWPRNCKKSSWERKKHKLNRYTDEHVDIVLLYPALVVYSLTSKCIRIFLLTVYSGW